MSSAAIKQVTEPFKIFVGENTTNVILRGYPDNGKATLKDGTSVIEEEYNGGDVTFPNYWEAWGVRTINGKRKNAKDYPIEVNDPEYRGDIEFLEYPDTEGQTIYCRYVKGQTSLDYDYQTLRLNLVKKEQDEQNLLLVLARGEHKVEPAKDRTYALMLKIHPMNGNSRYKTPRYTSSLYKEVNVYETQQANIRSMDIDFEAKSYVKASSTSFAKLKVLHKVLSDGGEIKFDATDENTLYDALMIFANEKPSEVIRLCTKYKQDTTMLIELCKSHKQFDTAKNGELLAGSVKKEIILSDIDASYKGEDMIQYLFDKAFEPKVFEAINKLHELSKNFK